MKSKYLYKFLGCKIGPLIGERSSGGRLRELDDLEK